MEYWNAMQDKWGFDDGESEPREGRVARAAYVTAVNALAERHGSAYRAVAFDRDGVHNHCMVLVLPVSAPMGLNSEGRKGAIMAMQKQKGDESEYRAFAVHWDGDLPHIRGYRKEGDGDRSFGLAKAGLERLLAEKMLHSAAALVARHDAATLRDFQAVDLEAKVLDRVPFDLDVEAAVAASSALLSAVLGDRWDARHAGSAVSEAEGK